MKKLRLFGLRTKLSLCKKHRLAEKNDLKKKFSKGKITIKWSQSRAGHAIFVKGRMEGPLFDTEEDAREYLRDLGIEESFQLNEIGDRPMNITNYDIDSTGQLSAKAVDKKLGIELNVRIGPAGVVEGKFTIVFEVNDRMDKTNEGNEIKVFSTVKHIVERWLADLDEDGISWSSIEFAASKDGSKKDVTSRERLYARFAKMIAKKYRGKLETKQATQYHMNHELDQIYTKYIIKKNISESTEVQLNEIGDRPMKISKFNISSDGVLRARAIDKDLNITLDVLIDEGLFAVEGYYLITFYVNESSEKTGTGHEIKVFSTVKSYYG